MKLPLGIKPAWAGRTQLVVFAACASTLAACSTVAEIAASEVVGRQQDRCDRTPPHMRGPECPPFEVDVP